MKNNRQNWFKLEGWWWAAILSVFCLAVWCRQIQVGGLSWSDAPIHAMDGVFLLDFVHALPAPAHDWAEEYYLRYPCLGLVTFYPPFFASVEALFYAVLGVSVFAARFCVAIFGLAGFWAMYGIGKQLFDRTAGLLAAGLWATLPMTVLWGRQVMLEVPTLAMILLCALCYLHYRSSKATGWLVGCAIFFTLAFFTKQWAAFFGVVLLADLLRSEGAKKTFATPNVLAGGASLIVIGAYMVLSMRYAALSQNLVKGDPAWRHLISPDHWLFYIRALPEVLSWPMIGFAGLGILIAAATRQLKSLQLAMIWAVVFYFFATVIAYKEPRYFYFFVPAGVLLAVGGLTKGLEKTNLIWAGRGLLGGLLVFQLLNGWFQNPDRLATFEPAAKAIVERADTDLVLVDANRDGDFIFNMRRLQGPNGEIVTLRGSKLLYSRAARRRWGYEAYVQNEADILNRITDYGIRYVVVESSPPNVADWQDFFPPPSQYLRKLLRDERLFERIAKFPVATDAVWHDCDIEVYRYRLPFGTLKKTITLPMPSVGRDIEIRLPARSELQK